MVREAVLTVTFEGKDISADIAPYLTAFSYTDNANKKQDSISITLEDRSGKWHADWFPKKGASVSATIRTYEWRNTEDNGKLFCGKFSVDEVEYSCPPSIVTFSGVAVPASSSVRGETRTRAWENTSVKTIAGDVAKSSGLSLVWDAKRDQRFSRVDQRAESDAALLQRLCDDSALNLKITDGKLVVYAAEDYDARDAAHTITPDDPDVMSWRMRTKTEGVYKSCKTQYWDNLDQKIKQYTTRPEKPPESGKALNINKRFESRDHAEAASKSALRKANKHEVSGDITLLGRVDIAAGQNVTLSGFGAFDGKLAVETATHTYTNSDGYVTQISLKSTITTKGYSTDKVGNDTESEDDDEDKD